MKKTPHVWVALTPHGFGHAAMTAPVIRELKKLCPNLRLTIQSGGLPFDFLRDRFAMPFDVVEETADFGLIMESATGVRVAESALAYEHLHENLPMLIDREKMRLSAAAPDLVLSNVSYVTIAAARQSGIAAVALCSLNWADLYWYHCADRPQADKIHEQILECYRQAVLFLRPAPAMPMPDLQTRLIGPIALHGENRRSELNERLGLGEHERLGIAAFGGLSMAFDMNRWPSLPGWHWLVDGVRGGINRPDMHAWQAFDYPLVDLIRSSDLIVSKPGYNTFSEAGVNGVPLLWVERPNWPENLYLDLWLKSNGKCETITTRDLFDRHSFEKAIDDLLSQSVPVVSFPDGAREAADILWGLLVGRR